MQRDALAAPVDLDLHGVVRVRLVGAQAADVRTVARQLGLRAACEAPTGPRMARSPARPASEIRVRFVERTSPGPAAYLEDRRIGYGGEGFFLRGSNGRGPWVRVPIDRLGSEECEFVAPGGCGGIPLLREALSLAALGGGLSPVHASAFRYGPAGVLVAGWAHSGKTSSLLAFAREGAAFVGDDQVFVDGDGSMYGTQAPLELSDWQLRQIPPAWDAVGRGRRAALRGLAAMRRLRGAGAAGAPDDRLARLYGGLERRLRLPLPPETVCARVEPGAAPLTHVAFASIHTAPEARVERCDSREMLERLSLLGRHERLPLARAHLAYQCAFPGRRNEWIERADEKEARLLRQALAGTETYLVHHPRPIALQRLFEAMRTILEAAGEPVRSRPARVVS